MHNTWRKYEERYCDTKEKTHSLSLKKATSLGLALLLTLTSCAVNTVAAGADGHIVGILGLAGSQPVHADAGQHIGNILLGDLLAVAGNSGKSVAGPDDAVIPQPDQRHGQGIFRNFAGDIRGSGGILDKGLDLPAATPPIQKIAGEQYCRGDGLAGSKIILLQNNGCRAEAQHHNKASWNQYVAEHPWIDGGTTEPTQPTDPSQPADPTTPSQPDDEDEGGNWWDWIFG